MTPSAPSTLRLVRHGVHGSPETDAEQQVIRTALSDLCRVRLADACAPRRLADMTNQEADEPPCQHADVLCVDPVMLAADLQLKARVVALASSGLPCVFYTESSPRSLQAVVSMQSQLTPVRLLIRGVDDSRQSLASIVALARRAQVGLDLASALAALTMTLPIGLRESIELVLRQPERFFDATDVARRAGLSRRHIDRILFSSRLAPAKDWVIAARAFHAARRLASATRTVGDVAQELGYSDEKALRRHTEAVWTLSPREAAALDCGILLMRVVRFVTLTIPN